MSRAHCLAALALGLGLVLAIAGCGRIAILTDPLSAAEHNDLGVAYEARGERQLAQREYRRALAIDPPFARARVNLANCEAAAGRWADAEHEYREALLDLPADPDGRNNLAVALLHRGRANDEAEWLARSATALAAGSDSIYRATLAEVLAARGHR